MEIQAQYEAWLKDPLIDEATKEELQQLEGQMAELTDRFFGWLAFGTGACEARLVLVQTVSIFILCVWRRRLWPVSSMTRV